MARIKGTNGNDWLEGTTGNDTYIGLKGRDYFLSSKGRDTFIANDADGTDFAVFSDLSPGNNYSDPNGVYVNLTSGKVIDGFGDRDTFVDIENVRGSAHDDTIIGDSKDNQLFGETGDDFLDGRGGWDFAWYGRAKSGVVIDMEKGLVTGGAGKDTLLNFEGVGGTNFEDRILGDSRDNSISLDPFGDKGAPNYRQGADDFVNGRGGIDTVFYFQTDKSIDVDLERGIAIDGGGHTDTLVSIENIAGSQDRDKIVGNAKANHLDGEGGKDRIDGGAGKDLLAGGLGSDTFVFSDGAQKDRIEDFSISDGDKVDLSGMPAVTNFADLHINQSGADAVLDFGGGDILTLMGVDADDLGKGQFIFA